MRLSGFAITLAVAVIACLATPASARNCVYSAEIDFRDRIAPSRAYLECLEAEIADLKREQTRFRARLDAYESVLAELPMRYRNEDGVATVAEGRKIGSARFVLSSRQTGGSKALPLDHNVITALCGAGAGCTISLYFRAIGFRATEPAEITVTGPCLLSYAPMTGGWARGEGCAAPGPVQGIDGNGNLVGAETGGEVVATAGACVLADSEPARPTGIDAAVFAPDRARGFHLIAAAELAPEARRFTCELLVE